MQSRRRSAITGLRVHGRPGAVRLACLQRGRGRAGARRERLRRPGGHQPRGRRQRGGTDGTVRTWGTVGVLAFAAGGVADRSAGACVTARLRLSVAGDRADQGGVDGRAKVAIPDRHVEVHRGNGRCGGHGLQPPGKPRNRSRGSARPRRVERQRVIWRHRTGRHTLLWHPAARHATSSCWGRLISPGAFVARFGNVGSPANLVTSGRLAAPDGASIHRCQPLRVSCVPTP